jgi:multicomponent Na+:H+ antiporter subunit D
MAAFTIGSLSMIGVPAVAGFTSKWYLAVGSMEAHSPAILFVIFASTVLNAAYFLPIVFRAYFKEPSALDRDFEHIGESPFFVVLPLAVTAVISIVIGVYPDYFLAIVERIF